MASSFTKSLQNASMASAMSLARTMSGPPAAPIAEESESTYSISTKYDWYANYKDTAFSIIDQNKNIVMDPSQINLTQEENSQFIPFKLPRYWDGIDLMDMSFRIRYVNSKGEEDIVPPKNVSYNDSHIILHWLVNGNATYLAGEVGFEIFATGVNEKNENYTWRTRPNGKLNILKSLVGNGMIQPTDEWIMQFIREVDGKIAEAKSHADAAKAFADEAMAISAEVDEKITNVENTLSASIENKIATELNNYYTKPQIDEFLSNIDFTEIEEKIDSIDGLANFDVNYDENTQIITFMNGETEIKTVPLNMTPSLEWTAANDAKVETKINESVAIVQTSLDEYKALTEADLQSIHNNIDNLPSTLESDYYNKEASDALLAGKADSATVIGLSTKLDAVEATANTNTTNAVAVSNKLVEIEERMKAFNTDPSYTYYATYDATTGQYTLWEVQGDVESVKSQFILSGGGGGSSSSTTVTIDRITSSPLVVTKGDRTVIEYMFTSVDSSGDDTGEGTATWKIDNSIVATSMALQGKNSFDLTDYVTVGTQKVTLSIIDAAGTISVKNWTIQVVDVRLETTFNDTYTYPLGEISFTYTPYGSIEKTVHFILDGQELESVVTNVSGIPLSYTLPSQSHGAHLLETYITAEVNGSTIETDHIFKDILWYDATSETPVIGTIYQSFTARQYDNTNIVYTVYDPKTETPVVSLAVDGVVVSTLTLDSPTQVWQYKSSDVGSHTLTISCKDQVKTIEAKIEKLNINVAPVTANLAFDFNPSGYSNSDANRLWTNGTNSMTVSDNFDWVNGGYQLDSNGDQYFCIKTGTRATIDYNLFADDARKNGKEFKIVFKTENVRRANATFLSCESGTTPIGLQMNVHEAYIKSSAESLYLPYSEEDIIEFDFNIFKDSEIPIVLHYEDGIPGRAMIYSSDYSFTQSSPVSITIGSDDCDVCIYRMKAYNSSLSNANILSNFIADASNADKMIDRYNRNQIYNENNVLTPESLAKACPDLKVIKLDCPYFTNNKSDFVKGTNIECIHTGGDPVLDNWKAVNCYHSGQGTTSNEYGQAGRNMDLLMCFDGNYTNKKITYDENYITELTMGDGTKYSDGSGKVTLTRNSVPANYLNVKVNIASSENWNNSGLASRYQEFLPYTTVASRRDSRIKTTMEFVNCVVFVREYNSDVSTHREFDDCEWHFYGMGNIGDSKKTDYTRVNDPDDHNEFVVEIMDNTLPNSAFQATEEALAALAADKFDEKGTYGFRYEHDDITDEEQQANMQTWRDFYNFVISSSDEDFVAHLGDWFIVESALYFYLFTERYTMIDNRAKNTFWHWSKVYISAAEALTMGEKATYYTIDDQAASINNGYRFDFWNYDNDSALGINNSGELTMPYGKEDIDYRTDGDPASGYIFNAAESTFFCRIRDLMYDRLAAMFVNRESVNCWSSSGLIAQADKAQRQFPEEVWRLDFERKYRRPYEEGAERYLKSMSQGPKKYQRRQWERDNEKYFATKYFGNTATSDQIMFRCNTPVSAAVAPNYTLHITPYSDMYVSVLIGATYRMQVRAKAGQEVVIPQQLETMDDTAILVYCASRIQDLGDLSTFYIHDNDFSKAIKLKVLAIGNAVEGYSNTFLTNLSLGNNRLLELLDIRNTPNLVSSLNLSGCGNLEQLYAEGSGVTGVVFSNGGKLRIAHLPALTSLTAKNLVYLEDLQIGGLDNMQTLIVENTPAINTYAYVTQSPNLTGVRLVGIDWGTDDGIVDTSVLERLIAIAGIDNAGYITDIAVLAGQFYSPVVKQMELVNYQNAWPDLDISYNTLVDQYIVTFKNEDGTVLDVQYVDKGGSAVDPITRPNSPIPVPTKESTVSTDFTYDKWEGSLEGIFADRVITATYTESVRSYDITYKAKGVVLQKSTGKYGEYVPYEGETPIYTLEESAYSYNLFDRWDKSGLIDGDKVVNAVFDSFSYSEGYFENKDIGTLRPVELYAMIKLGLEQKYIHDKDQISITFGHDFNYDDIESQTVISSKTLFDGNKYIDTGIKLFEEDRDFVIAIDYKFLSGCENLGVLAQCIQNDGSNGFKLWYNDVGRMTWGASSTNISKVDQREMIVLRHIKGDYNLYVYNSSLDLLEPTTITLEKNRSSVNDSTLVFGCGKQDDGAYEKFGVGEIHWCKIWYADLGDKACRQLAIWPHETMRMYASGFKRYYLSDVASTRSSVSFMAAHLMDRKRKYGQVFSSNAGGWAESTLNSYLNTRLVKAIPTQWQSLIKRVKVPSSIGGTSKEISTSNCYFSIPALAELYKDSQTNVEPYINEGSLISYMVTDEDRVRCYDGGEAGIYFLRSPNANYSGYIMTVTATGEIYGFYSPTAEYGVLLQINI